jgi:hypothetical protein
MSKVSFFFHYFFLDLSFNRLFELKDMAFTPILELKSCVILSFAFRFTEFIFLVHISVKLRKGSIRIIIYS